MSTTKTLDLDIELLTDVSVPASSRTLGAGRTLDYVPGRALWGAVATVAYARGLSREEGFRLFHRGALRFHDATPSLDGAPTFPTPRSWHEPKYGEGVVNLCDAEARVAARRGGAQYRPLEPAWRTARGVASPAERRYTLRTSVTASGRAGEGLLFGLDAIAAGTRLAARVTGAPADLERVAEWLGREVRLGRSRSAELGLARVSLADQRDGELELAQGRATSVRFLCRSRLALRDEATGATTFTCAPAAFGLPATWSFDSDASFVRTSRFSPFNAKRRRPELERHVIEVGSVITFAGDEPVDLDAVRARVAGGVGLWRNEGLGDVVVQPRWLVDREISLPDTPKPRAQAAPAPRDELFRWARERERVRALANDAVSWVEKNARSLARYDLNPSQWGEVRRLAREARHRRDGARWLRERLGDLVSSGLRALSSAWGAERGGQTAGQHLQRLLEEGGDDLPVRLELLASRLMRPSEEGER